MSSQSDEKSADSIRFRLLTEATESKDANPSYNPTLFQAMRKEISTRRQRYVEGRVKLVEVRTKEAIHMVNVAIEVRNGTARFMVAVRANNIQQASSIVQTRYPATVAAVKSPIDPEDFLVEERAA